MYGYLLVLAGTLGQTCIAMPETPESSGIDVINTLARGNIVIDLDHDFFFQSEDGVIDCPFNDEHGKPFPNDFFDLFKKIPFRTVINHEEALYEAVDADIEEAVWLHFDHHHDWYIDPLLLETLSPDALEGVLTEGNYIAIAARLGIIKNFVWIYPDCLEYPSAICIPDSLKNLGLNITMMSWSDYLTSLHQIVVTANVKFAVHCLSPSFVPEAKIREILQSCQNSEFVYRVLDTGYERNISRMENKKIRLFDKNLARRSILQYHGSSKSGIKSLINKKNHVSPSISFAACYCLEINSTEGWVQGIDQIGYDHEVIYLSPPAGKIIPHGVTGSIYQVMPNKEQVQSPGDCNAYDLVSSGSFDIKFENKLECVRSFLCECKVLLPEPNDKIALNTVYANRQFIDWMGVPLHVLECLRSTPFWLQIHQELRLDTAIVKLQPLIYWERLAIRCLYPLIKTKYCCNGTDDYHGFSHCRDVAMTSVVLAYSENVASLPAFIAALCHDLEPTFKSGEPDRAGESAGLTQDILRNEWSEFDGIDTEDIVDAVRTHSKVGAPVSKVSAILRDADRLRLSWERGYNSKFFHTDLGHELAKSGPNFHAHLIARLKFDKLTVLEIGRKTNLFHLSLWSCGRRYSLQNLLTLESSTLNRVIAEYNISYVVIENTVEPSEVAHSLPRKEVLNSNFVRKIFEFNDNGRKELQPETELERPLISIECNDLPELDKIKKLAASHEVHLAVSRLNFPNLIPILEDLVALNIQLVFVSEDPEVAGAEMAEIAEIMESAKAKNPNLNALRLITDLSWCWVEDPWVAVAILSHAAESYSPITNNHSSYLIGDIFTEILSSVRGRDKLCGQCAFVLNCVSSDYADTKRENAITPKFHNVYKSWGPYAPDNYA